MPPQGRDQAASQVTDQVIDYAGGLDRVTVPEAAERLGISENALRKRVQRDTVQWERDDDGRVFVCLPPAGTGYAADQADNYAADYAGGLAGDQPVAPVELVESLQEQVGYLRGALETRDKELAEMRRLLAGALERIPAIEPPPDTPTTNTSPEPARETSPEATGEPVSRTDKGSNGDVPPEQERRSWWRRLFEG
jgi:hypothetical protein